ncbi:hypothetical protein MSG28_008523 [Choristoneura fumiferana]|uniref:Uncharacterized protein n=1 Tax=Choristoneura fumiferana TaxID=7141 RepID=A0ACC0J723_CHOFU|nr:hypothetical protein MSG28_008523 [Choristoneura fumiferana]
MEPSVPGSSKNSPGLSSNSSSDADVLPENTLEVEKSLHASAVKNNLDDKVVTNDHVLALVKLREEEEQKATKVENPQPKLTRAKTAPWNLELTPIKHIPVKTRPEVKALIAQELHADEDDDEYQPTHDDSSFVPPDELPMPVVDDIWTEFLQECMNPEASKNEDDEDDPEYNVAADPDANDEDEEGLENIMKISKKELNDLVTELFNIMPEATAEDELFDKMVNNNPDSVVNVCNLRPAVALIRSWQESVSADTPENAAMVDRKVTPVKHELLPFNPNLTLYEQPEHEMPRIFVRHLAKSSRRHGRRTPKEESPPHQLHPRNRLQPPQRTPANRPKTPTHDKFDIEITPAVMPSTAPPVIPTLYSVVQTPSGAYLVPLSMITTNSASTPICSSEVKETVSSNLPEQSNVPTVPPATNDHCECCVLIRKICKERQTFMTDFFTPRVRTCPCKEKRRAKYPKITKKLRLLINSYKSKSFCAWEGLQCRVQSLTKELKRGEGKTLSTAVQYDLEEIAAVTSFQLKLTMRTAIARNNYMKRKVHAILSRFKPNEDDIYILMGDMDKALEAECVDVYKELLGFLTPVQADKMGSDGQKAAEPVSFKPLEQVAATSLGPLSNTEEAHEDIDDPKDKHSLEQASTTWNDSQVADKNGELNDTIYDDSQPIDYEADNSESDDDGSFENNLTIVEEPDEINTTEFDTNNESHSENIIDTPHLTITKTEVRDYSESDMSMAIMSDGETVKSEPAEWKRDEDKLLLEILKQSLTPKKEKIRLF